MNLKTRSTAEELLDQPGIPQADLFQNLRELDVINRLLGGHDATLKGIKKLMTDKNRTYRIIDLGCGGGDSLLAIHRWAKKRGYKVELTGLDLLPDAIEYAKQTSGKDVDINWICSDFKLLETGKQEYDIAICALFCHHLYGDNLDALLKKMYQIASVGVVINDLHRHWFAYHSIKWLTAILSRSHLVKNDAPMSVSKGFLRSELTGLLDRLGFKHFSVSWIWAFRWMVLIKK